MIDYQDFISKQKSLLIAPAGYGKTHTISECLKYTTGKQLILTHTHAGVSSINEKLQKNKIPSNSYNVETISSFAQKYVLSFSCKDLPTQEDKNYFIQVLSRAELLFRSKLIKSIIKSSYNGLFVDEYQDCTERQHKLIITLSEILPTRIIGDPLQAIFSFKKGESLVNMECPTQMKDFLDNSFKLESPQRWINANNVELGNQLKEIQDIIKRKQQIDLNKFNQIELHLINDSIYSINNIKEIICSYKNLLIIDPKTENNYSRINFIKRLCSKIRLIEPIDSKEFYKLSKKFDELDNNNLFTTLKKEIFDILFKKKILNKWFNEKGLKNKKKLTNSDNQIYKDINNIITSLKIKISFSKLANLLEKVKNLPDMKCYRKELFESLHLSLIEAETKNISVYKEMCNQRNLIRRKGRKIYGKCIGTTLLTKGLEFENVLIINAHDFDCYKNLYVALTRASKKLIVFSKESVLNPYKTK